MCETSPRTQPEESVAWQSKLSPGLHETVINQTKWSSPRGPLEPQPDLASKVSRAANGEAMVVERKNVAEVRRVEMRMVLSLRLFKFCHLLY